MLLRELNHRVKNNLASIIGLLSYRVPRLEPKSRKWLDRVIDRIGAMAGTHDLFSGGLERVGLAELVEQALRPIIVSKPLGVTIQRELDVPVFLRTDRAVSLAMILHELAFNALAHGLGENGTLTMRGELRQESLIIQVIDDGVGLDAASQRSWAGGMGEIEAGGAVAVAGTPRVGMGLDLVRGLVGRELRGQFNISANTTGGTTATVEFPLVDGETAKQGIYKSQSTGDDT